MYRKFYTPIVCHYDILLIIAECPRQDKDKGHKTLIEVVSFQLIMNRHTFRLFMLSIGDMKF